MADDLKSKALEWRKKLLSDDANLRKTAMEDMLGYAIKNLDDKSLEHWIDTDRYLVYEFQHSLYFDSWQKYATRAEVVNIFRKNWDTVIFILNHPVSFRDQITEKGTKHQILFTEKGTNWLNYQCEHLLYYIKVVTYDYYCPACQNRISSDPNKPYLVKKRQEVLERDASGIPTKLGRILAVEFYHVPCALPKKPLIAAMQQNRK